MFVVHWKVTRWRPSSFPTKLKVAVQKTVRLDQCRFQHLEVSTGKLCGNAGLMTPEHRYELEDGWANAHVGLKSLDFVFSCDLLLLLSLIHI